MVIRAVDHNLGRDPRPSLPYRYCFYLTTNIRCGNLACPWNRPVVLTNTLRPGGRDCNKRKENAGNVCTRQTPHQDVSMSWDFDKRSWRRRYCGACKDDDDVYGLTPVPWVRSRCLVPLPLAPWESMPPCSSTRQSTPERR